MKNRNTQQQLINWLTNNPCKTELEIVNHCFNDKHRDKKHADLIRRALYTGKIDRVRVKFKGVDSRKLFRYFVTNTFMLTK
jgi:hypothetical protein